MLDRSKLLVQLHKVADQLFADDSVTHGSIFKAWSAILADPLFLHKVKAVADAPWPVPLWEGELGLVIQIVSYTQQHVVLSVDGSQIYPDRHHVSSCFLINTGSVILPYGVHGKRVELFSSPTVYKGVDKDQMPYTVDMVNCKRQELELREGLALAQRIKSEDQAAPILLLFDGSLIFWHLLSKDSVVKDLFLHRYCTSLNDLYQENIIAAWYISSPKSKELVSLLRLYLCNFEPEKKALYEETNIITDSTIMQRFLPPLSRSIVFKNCSSISNYYPSCVAPYFFYMNTGHEIGRVEIPAWIAKDEALITMVACIVLDQCVKGGGYPVALAEAHEQAVIKGPDRDFFYHMLQKMVIDRGKSVVTSRKSLKKRGMGI